MILHHMVYPFGEGGVVCPRQNVRCGGVEVVDDAQFTLGNNVIYIMDTLAG